MGVTVISRYGLVTFALLASSPADLATAQPPSSRASVCEAECTRARAAERDRLLETYGLPSLERLRDERAAVRRVFYVDGNGRDVIAMTFIRARGHAPELTVHFPRRSGEPERRPLRTALAASVWRDVRLRSEHFDRALVPVPPAEQTICIHGWIYTAEATDPGPDATPGEIRRATEDACADGLVSSLGSSLYAVAVPLFPQCDLLQRDQHRNGATLLAECGRLSGDTLAAAEAYNRIGGLKGGGNPEHRPLLRSILYGATLEWEGVRLANPPEAWLARTSEPQIASFFPLTAHGETSGRVRMTGTLERWIHAGERSVRENAPVELLWTRRQDGIFTVERAVIGAFVRPAAR